MYAVIRAGGKQHKVAQGDVIEVEKVKETGSLEFKPLLVVGDDGKVTSAKSDLQKATVSASVVAETKGPKIEVFKYRNKTRYRRKTGHRQQYTQIKIDAISLSGSKAPKKTAAKKTSAARSGESTAKKSTSETEEA